MPCVIYRHVIACPVDVGLDHHLLVVVDTGTRRTVLDRSVAERLGLAARPDTLISLGADIASANVILPSLRFGRLWFRGLHASVCDLDVLAASIGVRPDGILGMDVLGLMNFTIDYKRSRVTIGQFGALSHRTRLETTGDFPLVNVEVGRRRVRLVVDTGADGMLVFATPGGRSPADREEGAVEALGLWGSTRLPGIHVMKFRIADVQLRPKSVALADAASAGKAYDADGLFGVRTLNASLVSFDFIRRELSWEN